MTLGQAFVAKVRLLVWCKTCQHQAEPLALLGLRRPRGGFRRQRRGSLSTVPPLSVPLIC